MSIANLPQTRRQTLDSIIAMVLDDMSLRDAVAHAGIKLQTFHTWLSGDKEAALNYVRALELRADLMVDDAKKLADGDGDPAKVRNQMDIRRWMATKQNSKRYGERVDLNVTQTIDVSSVLLEARARVMLPGRDQQTITDVQTLDSPSVSVPRALDIKSIRDDVPRDGDAPDIFS